MPRIPLPPAEPMKLESLAEVARGGMGSVEIARVLDGRMAGQNVALKRLHPNIAEDPEFVSMFMDEVWMTSALKHPNVAQVIAWGNDEHGMFLAIELVQGVSLSRLIKEAQQNQEPFAERTVAFLCSQLCAGMTAAHTLTAPDGAPLGLVHRDLTPANILISFEGIVKIIDFGIAKAEERITHTRTGQLKGKPAYMAPEQQRGGQVDARADLFSFGVMMYEMLAGRRPWMSKGAFDVMMEISNDPHPDLGELRRGLNPEFVAMAHKCLAKKPDERFESAAEIKGRLDAWLTSKGFTADDQHSFAQFVLRNSQPQVKWWQEALRGEHAKKKAPTFKELEEKIDEDRERQAKAARRAARPPPPKPGAGTVPLAAFPGGPPSADRSAPPASAMPASAMPASALPASAMPASSMPVSAMPASPPAAVPASKRVTGAGTEFMAMSPFSQGAPLSPPQRVSSIPSLPQGPAEAGSAPRSAEASYPASQRFSPPSGVASQVNVLAQTTPSAHASIAQTAPMSNASPPVVAPAGTESGTIPMSPALLVPPAARPASVPPPASRSAPASGSAQVPGSAPRPARRSRLGIALVVVILLGGAGTGAWFMRDTLLGLVGAGAPAHAPRSR